MSQVKTKRVLFGAVASTLAIATPLAVVISCGEDKKTPKENNTQGNNAQGNNTQGSTDKAKESKSYEEIVKEALSDAKAHYRMEIISPVTSANSKNKKAAPKGALATARRKSGSQEKWYENSIFASDFSGTLGQYDYKILDANGDKTLKESLKQHKRIVITDMTKKKDGIRTIPGKIFILKSAAGYIRYAIVIDNVVAKDQPKTDKDKTKDDTKSGKTDKKQPDKTEVTPKITAPEIISSEYKVELKERKAALEKLAQDTKRTKIFIFDNGHEIKPVFGNTKSEYIALIKGKLAKYGFSNTSSKRGSIYKQGYASKTGFKLYTSKKVFKTIEDAANEWEASATPFIKEVEVNKVIIQMISDLRAEFKSNNLKADFSILDKREKAIASTKVIPVTVKATSDALIAKYITNPATNKDTVIFDKGEFINGSKNYALSVKATKEISGKKFGYFVTVGMMLGKKEKVDSKINFSTLVNGVESIAFIKTGSGHYKSFGFTFVKVGGVWYFAPDYIKSIFSGMTFKNNSYWGYDLSTIDTKYSDLLSYTKQILNVPKPTPAPPTPTTSVNSIY
ncbi:hypothetical protein MYMA111404_01760 [Mycoplasma marinum]|uniref:TNase-like domain-containing protein n=1 Tax=Mycoplasma marinum TaxID=1937190 RepID=A0A4V2NIC0_9MOLU|nr:hypothetical protein [Mycoplasma marinum]TCG11874.1 hypothetical protein C4B24_00565 [Mycoplasma marinum]